MKDTKISPETLCASLLANHTIRATADALKVSERTIYTMMREPEFMELYDQSQADILETALGECQNLTIEAINCMAEIMKDATISPQIRLNAARNVVSTITGLRSGVMALRGKATTENFEDVFKHNFFGEGEN